MNIQKCRDTPQLTIGLFHNKLNPSWDTKSGAGEMALQLKLLLQGTWVYFPGLTWRLTTQCDSSSRGIQHLLLAFEITECTYTGRTLIHIHLIDWAPQFSNIVTCVVSLLYSLRPCSWQKQVIATARHHHHSTVLNIIAPLGKYIL